MALKEKWVNSDKGSMNFGNDKLKIMVYIAWILRYK